MQEALLADDYDSQGLTQQFSNWDLDLNYEHLDRDYRYDDDYGDDEFEHLNTLNNEDRDTSK